MLEQIDHRGKRFTIDDDDDADTQAVEQNRRAEALEHRAQYELRELEHAKAVAGPAGESPDVEVLER